MPLYCRASLFSKSIFTRYRNAPISFQVKIMVTQSTADVNADHQCLIFDLQNLLVLCNLHCGTPPQYFGFVRFLVGSAQCHCIAGRLFFQRSFLFVTGMPHYLVAFSVFPFCFASSTATSMIMSSCPPTVFLRPISIKISLGSTWNFSPAR